MERVLLVARYSGDDEAGAIDRQRDLLAAWQSEDPGRVMAEGPDGGWVIDETVSGSINLDERRSLGQWMREPLLHSWDTMAVTWQDRVTRDDIHWWVFVGRLIQWGKRLVVLDDPTLDLSTPNGRMIAGIKATQAANYRQDVIKKIKAAREAYREQRRFVGGHWRFGYRAVPREGEEGWELVVDPVSSKWVREAVDRIIDEDLSVREIIRDWKSRGIPTARAFQAQNTPPKPGVAPREPKSYEWQETSLVRILLSPNLLGFATHNKELIRADGIPVQFADPIITPDEALELNRILEKRGEAHRGLRKNRSPLLGVVFCGCGRPMNATKSKARKGSAKVYNYYRCALVANTRGVCPIDGKNWPVATVQSYLEGMFLEELGDEEIRTRKFIPGVNHNAEISSLTEAIQHLTDNLGELPKGSRAARAAIDKLAVYEARLDELEAQPTTPAQAVHTPTGKTFRQRWSEMKDWSERGAFLMRAGIRIEFAGVPWAPEVHLFWPEDLIGRAQRAIQNVTPE